MERKVEKEAINKFLKSNNKFRFKSTSPALTKDNSINDLFQEISEILYLKNNNAGSLNKVQNNIHLNRTIGKKQFCLCCKEDY